MQPYTGLRAPGRLKRAAREMLFVAGLLAIYFLLAAVLLPRLGFNT